MKKILVVDDDVTIHQLIRAIILIIGDIQVESCYDGREALEKALADSPDLIISDVNMPDMDGLTLTQNIRETPAIADTPILLLTARGEEFDRVLGLELGADDYVVWSCTSAA